MATDPARPRTWVGTGVPGPGRPKGSRNRLTMQAQNAFRAAFERLGGVNALVAWAQDNPGDFYRIYGRVLRPEPEATDKTVRVVVSRMVAGSPLASLEHADAPEALPLKIQHDEKD